jgi:hypothetical protein
MLNELMISINKIKKVSLFKLEDGLITIDFDDKLKSYDIQILNHHFKTDYNNIEVPIKIQNDYTISFKFKND